VTCADASRVFCIYRVLAGALCTLIASQFTQNACTVGSFLVFQFSLVHAGSFETTIFMAMDAPNTLSRSYCDSPLPCCLVVLDFRAVPGVSVGTLIIFCWHVKTMDEAGSTTVESNKKRKRAYKSVSPETLEGSIKRCRRHNPKVNFILARPTAGTQSCVFPHSSAITWSRR
jgi:hypothetical protein